MGFSWILGSVRTKLKVERWRASRRDCWYVDAKESMTRWGRENLSLNPNFLSSSASSSASSSSSSDAAADAAG